MPFLMAPNYAKLILLPHVKLFQILKIFYYQRYILGYFFSLCILS